MLDPHADAVNAVIGEVVAKAELARMKAEARRLRKFGVHAQWSRDDLLYLLDELHGLFKAHENRAGVQAIADAHAALRSCTLTEGGRA